MDHFLIVAFPVQGHISPARALARRIAAAAGSPRVTVSVALSGHRRMFSTDGETSDGAISYVPYSDGYDAGFIHSIGDPDFVSTFAAAGAAAMSAILTQEASRGRPVTFVIFTPPISWAPRVAGERGIPSAMYWINPAAVLPAYYHYFHGFKAVVDEHAGEPEFELSFPSMAPMKIRHLPSILTAKDRRNDVLLEILANTMEAMEIEIKTRKPTVLANTADVLEHAALAAVTAWDVIPIGPIIPALNGGEAGMYKEDEKKYMEWLDTKAAMSVVYIAFGSMSVFKPRQLEEIKKALAGSGRPFLWVVRKDNSAGGGSPELDTGMVVEWCDQVKVLSHGAVGCFVTHCGWNSTVESVISGVPMVALPDWTDQETNARSVVEWGVGVRGEADGDGVVAEEEMRRCIDVAMGEEMRRNAAALSVKVRAAIGEGGSSERNFNDFLIRSRRQLA